MYKLIEKNRENINAILHISNKEKESIIQRFDVAWGNACEHIKEIINSSSIIRDFIPNQ